MPVSLRNIATRLAINAVKPPPPDSFVISVDDRTDNIVVCNTNPDNQRGFCVTRKYLDDHDYEGVLSAVNNGIQAVVAGKDSFNQENWARPAQIRPVDELFDRAKRVPGVTRFDDV